MVYSEPSQWSPAKADHVYHMKLWSMAEGYVIMLVYLPYVIAVLASSWVWDRMRAMVGLKPR